MRNQNEMIAARMLYKSPGPHAIHGGQFDYIIVDENDCEWALADGWTLTTDEAKAAAEQASSPAPTTDVADPNAQPADSPVDTITPPTRDELEAKAKELGIGFNSRTTDETLLDRIEDAIKA